MRKRDEPVRLTRIYTRGGDAGKTSLGDGSRVAKTDLRIEACGTVDELNSVLGLVLAAEPPAEFRPWLEQVCDLVNQRLEPLKSFVLPGGGEVAARLHLARTVCRRAERRAVTLAETAAVNPVAVAYLNRLSDLLFILARASNAEAGRPEPVWKPGASR